MVFPSLEIIAEEQIEHLLRQRDVLGHDLDEPPCGGVHRRHPHHLRVVLTETLGAVDRDLLALEYFRCPNKVPVSLCLQNTPENETLHIRRRPRAT